MISGRTALFGILGSPVGHSLSPAMQNAAFAAAGFGEAHEEHCTGRPPRAFSGTYWWGLALASSSWAAVRTFRY